MSQLLIECGMDSGPIGWIALAFAGEVICDYEQVLNDDYGNDV